MVDVIDRIVENRIGSPSLRIPAKEELIMAGYVEKVANKIERIVDEVHERDWLDAILMAVRLCVAMASEWKKRTGLEKKAILIQGVAVGVERLKKSGKIPWMTSTLEFAFLQVLLPPIIETVYRSFLMESEEVVAIETDWDHVDDEEGEEDL